MLSIVENDELAPVAEDVRSRLGAVVEHQDIARIHVLRQFPVGHANLFAIPLAIGAFGVQAEAGPYRELDATVAEFPGADLGPL